jgi:hypothetical protein
MKAYEIAGTTQQLTHRLESTVGDDFTEVGFEYTTAEIETSVFEGEDVVSEPKQAKRQSSAKLVVVHGEFHQLTDEEPTGAQPLTHQAGLFRTVGMAADD